MMSEFIYLLNFLLNIFFPPVLLLALGRICNSYRVVFLSFLKYLLEVELLVQRIAIKSVFRLLLCRNNCLLC